jgi:bla regulator protein BlaR1
MNASDVMALLVEATLASSAAIVLVLALRGPLRRRFGAATAYAAWWLVPAALVAVALPAAVAPVGAPAMQGGTAAAGGAGVAAMSAGAAFDLALLQVGAWLGGALAVAAWLAVQQRRFRRSLGPLHRRSDGVLQAASTAGLPAALGLLRPQVVVPVDFERRYSAPERELMLAHELSHVRHGDLHANALVAALRCLFWFNPLVPLAARHFRHDQELACDARVIARHPGSRRAYGEAMFRTQLAAQPLPLGCHWGFSHPLKERIAMLKQPVPTLARKTGGVLAVAGLTLVFAYSAWAAQPARMPTLVVAADSADRTLPPMPAAPEAPPAPPAPHDIPAPPAPPAPHDIPAPPAPPAPPPPPPALPAASERTPPAYPEHAAEQGIDGKVVLLVDVDAEGKALDVQVEKSEPAGVFDQAAIDAARQWRFTPAVEDGRTVPGRVRVPIQFEADGAGAPSA